MPSAIITRSPSADELSVDIARELRRIRRSVSAASGIFALFPVEADLSDATRDRSLTELANLLGDSGQRLRVLRLTSDDWNPASVLSAAAPYAKTDVVLLTGFEKTPAIADARQPPPALASLNVEREPLERELAVPLILWSPAWVIRALQHYAPDFFDHFSSIFRIAEAEQESARLESLTVKTPLPTPSIADGFLSLRRVESTIAFYRQQLLDR